MANGNHSTVLVRIGQIVLPFVIGVGSAAFWFGTRSANVASNQKTIMEWKAIAEPKIDKLDDVLNWKTEVAPQIQRMDNKGTAAGEQFSLNQAKELGRLDERLKDVEKDSRQIETMKLKIDTLERAMLSRSTPTKP
jgi:hypothetical protein